MNAPGQLLELHQKLKSQTYVHSQYSAFVVCDPKRRQVHKACVLDRVLHHAVYRVLYPILDPTWIHDSYASRVGRGTHAAVDRFHTLAWRLSANNTRTVWVLQCDVRQYFASVDHAILIRLLACKFPGEPKLLWLLGSIIGSFESEPGIGCGMPIGNLTSQLFSNVYLDQLDQYLKRQLSVKIYLRYADDMLVAHTSQEYLVGILVQTEKFLGEKLFLKLHPHKTSIKTWASGVDFLGYVDFPHYRLLRTRTKRRLFRHINSANSISYLGLLRHCSSAGIERQLGVKEAYSF